MNDEAERLDRLLELSQRLAKKNSMGNRLRSRYFGAMFHATRVVERLPVQRKRFSDKNILNFGCGLNFIDGVNSDLLPLHRFVKGTRQPDLYLSGTYAPPHLNQRFETIICEHVLEHVLPAAGLTILRTLHQLLKPGGRLQISVPSTVRYISCTDDRIRIDGIGLNENTYNYGHMFMYDPETLKILMKGAGFQQIEENSYETSPFRNILVEKRSPVSIYALGTKD